VKSRATKRREAWQLIAWMGAVIAGLLILYWWSEGAPFPGTSAMAPFTVRCRMGYLISVVVGAFVTFGWSSLLFWLLDTYVKPADTEAAGLERIWWIAVMVGVFERILITTLVAHDISGVASFIAGWIGIKMVSGWQRWGSGTRYARAASFMALLGNVMSVLFGVVGGVLCKASATPPPEDR
jgi:hypothetical protein